MVHTPRQAKALVTRYHELGYDLIKAYGYLEHENFKAVIEQAQMLELPIVKHGPNAVPGGELALNQGMQSLEHVEDIFQGPLDFEYDSDKLKAWIDQLSELKPVITPTLATFDHLTQLSAHKASFVETLALETLNPVYRQLMSQTSVARWLNSDTQTADWNKKVLSHLFKITQALDHAGITLLVGSDAGTMYMTAGDSTHREIELMHQAGLSRLTVLQAATINAARALKVDNRLGSVTIGKTADLVITQANPLQELATLRTPVAVMKNGQWLPSDTLNVLKQSSEQPSNAYLALGRLLEDLLGRALFHP